MQGQKDVKALLEHEQGLPEGFTGTIEIQTSRLFLNYQYDNTETGHVIQGINLSECTQVYSERGASKELLRQARTAHTWQISAVL